ncbi:WD40-like Beta Propeller [Penicillium hordei]|uniref:WD40-like Beta Propeller n=1 Tax=Penicillium hordei TaxID=40994 RepID=A0AAD6GTQ6_9EURO|nr:WD40-like Beta Propeller [Penicillium hordei]KAJ5588465.1 WD40-like Beta Propeller [Penicillium hordei]
MVTNPDYKANLSLEALADLQVPGDLYISPDAAKIVYKLQYFSKKGENATSSIWIAVVGKEKSTRQFTSGLFSDEQPKWSPDGTSLAFKSDRGHLGKSSTIYVMQVDGGEPYPIMPDGNKKPIAAFGVPTVRISFTSPDEKTDEQVHKEKAKDDATVWGENLEHHRLELSM